MNNILFWELYSFINGSLPDNAMFHMRRMQQKPISRKPHVVIETLCLPRLSFSLNSRIDYIIAISLLWRTYNNLWHNFYFSIIVLPP